MRDPENRRGVPLRAGVSLVAVAATVAATFALASPASAAGQNPSGVSVSPKTATVYQNQTQSYTISSTPAAAGNTVVAEATVASTAVSSPLTMTPAGAVCAANGAKTSWTCDLPLSTTASGTVSFTVASSVNGTVSIDVGAGTSTPSASPHDTASLTVKATNAGGAQYDVNKLAVQPSSATIYTGDTAEFTVTGTDASGLPVLNAPVYAQVSNGVGGVQTAIGPHATDNSGQAVFDIADTALTPNSTVSFWVDNSTASGATTGKQDAGDTSTSASATVIAPPPVSATNSSLTTSVTSDLQAGKATNVPFTLTLKNAGGAAVGGAHVALDVTDGNGNTTRYNATTASDGTANFSVPVSAANATGTLDAEAYLSGSTMFGDGADTTLGASVTFAAAHAVLTAPTAVSAQVGGTVSFPVSVADQFGNLDSTYTSVSYVVTGRNATTGTVNLVGGKATISYPDKGTSGTTDSVALTTNAGSAGALTKTTAVQFKTSVAPANITFNGPAVSAKGVDKTATQTVVATVKNGNNEILAGAPVTISVNIGFVSLTSGTNSGKSSQDMTTDPNGQVTFYVGSEQMGVQTITAKSGSFSANDSATVSYAAGAPVKVTISGPTEPVAPGSSTTVTAKAEDALGNGVPGQQITFSASDPSVLPGSVSPVTVTSGANGSASVVISIPANTTSTGGTITAFDAAVTAPNNVASLAYKVGSAAKVKVAGTKGVSAGGTEKIAVRTWNADGTLAGGVTVNIKVSGANSVTGTATTGPNGELGYFTYKAKNAGTDTVTATVGSVKASTKVTISSGQGTHLFHPAAMANGTFLFSAQSVPAAAGVRVNLFAVYHPGKSDQMLLNAGNGTTNSAGRVVKATSPGYLAGGKFKQYKAGASYVLVARAVGGSLSNTQTVTAK